MRISDWSSDVCSSDLMAGDGFVTPLLAMTAGSAANFLALISDPQPDPQGSRRPQVDRPDRKSVVSGKSVSVRVDLGGRRILKNTKTNKEKHKETEKRKGSMMCMRTKTNSTIVI